jgi:hypothetical protein
MKKVIFLAILATVLVAVAIPVAQAQNRVVLKVGTLAASAIDTVFVELSKKYDYFGLGMSADSACNIQVNVDARDGSGKWYTAKVDTFVSTVAGGAGWAKSYRTAEVESVPWGADNLRIRFSKLASGNASVLKAYTATIHGVLIRSQDAR